MRGPGDSKDLDEFDLDAQLLEREITHSRALRTLVPILREGSFQSATKTASQNVPATREASSKGGVPETPKRPP